LENQKINEIMEDLPIKMIKSKRIEEDKNEEVINSDILFDTPSSPKQPDLVKNLTVPMGELHFRKCIGLEREVIELENSDEYMEEAIKKHTPIQKKFGSLLLKPHSFFIKERFFDLDRPSIDPKFKKKCGCPGILIVDDQYMNRFIVQQYCAKYSVECFAAEDGKEAVECVSQAANKN
jgi:hypothetical protein